MNLRDQQLQYEEETDSQAAAERLEALKNSSADGDVNLPRAQRFIARAYIGVKQSLEDALAVPTRGVGGKFKGWLRKVPTDVAAVLAIRECIRQLSTKRFDDSHVTVQSLATDIGRLYELEVRIREAEQVNPLYMQRVHDQVQEHATTNQRHLRKLYNTAYVNVMKGEMESSLTTAEALHLGKFGVQACLDAGIILLRKGIGHRGTLHAYELDPSTAEFLQDYGTEDVIGLLDKSAGAMMCPPDPWTNLTDGGYLSTRRKHAQPLMKVARMRKAERPRIRAEFTAEKMPIVFEAANYLQAVPFSVHTPTLAAIQRIWSTGGGVLGVPMKSGPTKPAFPHSPEWIKEGATQEELDAQSVWKFKVVQWYEAMKIWRGKVREVTGFIKVAARQPENIWFPVFFDSRGRWYYRGSPNPQGSDLSKAALHFGRKKPLGERGLYWLKVHIANCYGFDKERFDIRAKWTEDNWDRIRNALSDPENHTDVWGTDAPWCMFSAAWELNAALSSPDPAAYKTGIPVHMDATCSGLQHFSAMLRDPIGGGFVNLYDDAFVGPKQDIYSRVSTNALEAIKRDAEDSDPDKAAMALWWLKTGIPRSMAKTPVMTYVYGATLRGTAQHVQLYVQQDMGLDFPEGKRPYDYAAYAGKKLFQGIASTVPAAEAAMQWLRNVARQQPCGKRMEWRSPTGFLVQHDYQDFTEVRVKLRSCGVLHALIREYNEDTRPMPMQNAIAPNFVHALDASHLTMCALSMKANGLDMVGIHDSFGTHASDVDQLHASIRDSFVDLYQGRNVLAEFLWEVDGVGEVPMRGTLDLERVRESEFFFC